MSQITLYHCSPSRFRGSIEREGLRRSSMYRGQLVSHLFVRWPLNGDGIKVAELHDTIPACIDIWKCKCEDDDLEFYVVGERVLYSDLPANRVQLVRTAVLER